MSMNGLDRQDEFCSICEGLGTWHPATCQAHAGCFRTRQLTNEAHAIKDSGIEHQRHSTGIDGLPAEGPCVWALREIQLGWHNGSPWLILLQDVLHTQKHDSDHNHVPLTVCCESHNTRQLFISQAATKMQSLVQLASCWSPTSQG